MAGYTCKKCGMSIGSMTCGKCGKELKHGTITTADSKSVPSRNVRADTAR
ncbi:MAG: hypothetical protein IPK65_00015 [Gammaproteobacteria bacterium]|nr:hypothetical protein [Gammaproteobacteria bacterium]